MKPSPPPPPRPTQCHPHSEELQSVRPLERSCRILSRNNGEQAREGAETGLEASPLRKPQDWSAPGNTVTAFRWGAGTTALEAAPPGACRTLHSADSWPGGGGSRSTALTSANGGAFGWDPVPPRHAYSACPTGAGVVTVAGRSEPDVPQGL